MYNLSKEQRFLVAVDWPGQSLYRGRSEFVPETCLVSQRICTWGGSKPIWAPHVACRDLVAGACRWRCVRLLQGATLPRGCSEFRVQGSGFRVQGCGQSLYRGRAVFVPETCLVSQLLCTCGESKPTRALHVSRRDLLAVALCWLCAPTRIPVTV